MPRFFLHVRNGSELVEDPDGEEFDTLAAAEREAEAAARDLMAERLRCGLSMDVDREMVISAEDGAIASTIPFRRALPGDAAKGRGSPLKSTN